MADFPLQDGRTTRQGLTDPQFFGRLETDSATALAASFFPAATVFTLTLDEGAFTLSGQAMGLYALRQIGLETGDFVLTGEDVGLEKVFRLELGTGEFALTGYPIASPPEGDVIRMPSSLVTRYGLTTPQLFGRTSDDSSEALNEYFFGPDGITDIALETGTFSLTGHSVGLLRSARIALETGAFTLTGHDVALSATTPFVLETGSFSFTGQAVGLLRSRRITLGTGAFTLTGQAVSLERSRRLTLGTGSFSFTGQDVLLAVDGEPEDILDVGILDIVSQNTPLIVLPAPTATSTIGHLFNIAARHYRHQRFHDGQGGWEEDWTLIGTIACRLSSPSGRDAQIASQRQAVVTHAVYTSSDIDIQYGDALEINDIWYLVTVPDLRPSIRDHHLKVLTEQRQKRAA
jgi:hypothetical protein